MTYNPISEIHLIMKSKALFLHIFIYTILLCVAAQGVSFSRICTGPAHDDSDIDWADNCHPPANDGHDSPRRSLNHEDGNCIDIFITSVAATIGNATDDPISPLCAQKPLIIKSDTFDHLFSFFNFSQSSPILFPAFTDITFLSIASTILII